jgi:hypothetical protein
MPRRAQWTRRWIDAAEASKAWLVEQPDEVQDMGPLEQIDLYAASVQQIPP